MATNNITFPIYNADGLIHVGRDVNIVGSHCVGHRDFSSKDCPSFDATKEYKNI